MLNQLATNNFANEEVRALAEGEIERLRSYKRIYVETHPMPKKKTVNFLTALGLEAVLIAASSIAAVIVAGLRTFDAFYNMFNSANTLPLFTVIGSVAAIVAVEGLLMATGLIQGKERGTRLSTTGTVTAFIISVAAGFVVSLSPIKDNLAQLFGISQYVLSIATAIGASVLAYIGGLVSGSILYKWEELQIKTESDYDQHLLAWDEAAQRAYHRQGRTGIFGLESLQPETASKKKPKQTQKQMDTTDAVREYLKYHNLNASDVGQEPGLTMTPAQLAEEIGATGGAVRTALSRMRNAEASMNAKTLVPMPNGEVAELKLEDVVKAYEPEYVPVEEDPIF